MELNFNFKLNTKVRPFLFSHKYFIVNINNFYWKENIENTYSRTIINSILNDYDVQIIKLPILNGNTSIGWNLVSDTHTTHMDTLVQPIIGVYILCLERL